MIFFNPCIVIFSFIILFTNDVGMEKLVHFWNKFSRPCSNSIFNWHHLHGVEVIAWLRLYLSNLLNMNSETGFKTLLIHFMIAKVVNQIMLWFSTSSLFIFEQENGLQGWFTYWQSKQPFGCSILDGTLFHIEFNYCLSYSKKDIHQVSKQFS